MKSNIRYLWLQVEDKLRSLDEDMSYFMDRLGKANMEDICLLYTSDAADE